MSIDGASKNNLISTVNRLIQIANIIDNACKKLSEKEAQYGPNAEQCVAYINMISFATTSEYNLIREILEAGLGLEFKDIIIKKDIKRLIEKLNDEFEFTERLLDDESRAEYKKEKPSVKKVLSLERYLRINRNEFGKHILRHTVFNIIQSKMYVKVLDEYIKGTDDLEEKQILIEEKYRTIFKNMTLQSWYFDEGFNNDWMLVDCDRVMALELGTPYEEYLRLKNDYYENAIENCIDLLVSDSEDDKTLLEANFITALLCMNEASLSNSFNIVEDDMVNNPSAYNEDSKKFIEQVYAKRPKIENRIRTRCPKEEV